MGARSGEVFICSIVPVDKLGPAGSKLIASGGDLTRLTTAARSGAVTSLSRDNASQSKGQQGGKHVTSGEE